LKSPHLLLASGNARKLKAELVAVLPPEALDTLEAEIHRNVREIVQLGILHLDFAVALTRKDWRHCVSRLYYACYAASRAIRLEVHGHFLTESGDHRRIGDLPDDFPRREEFKNQLLSLREDRNLADYDHTSAETDLVFSFADARAFAADFLNETKGYLVARGVTI
jgi:hypothetical protein